MATLALNIDMPVGVVFDATKIKALVTNYVLKLVTMDNYGEKKSNVDGFMQLKGTIKSDISFDDMRRDAIKEKYGV